MYSARHRRLPLSGWARWLAVAAIFLFAGGAGITALALRATAPTGGATFTPSTVTTLAPAARAGLGLRPLTKSVPTHIRIPAIGINAPVIEVGKNADGSAQVPPLANPNLVGWYKYGPAPGQRGAAVILGHVDSYAGTSVFFHVKDLRQGDKIYITLADGQLATFAVDGVQKAAKSNFPTSSVYGSIPYPGLRLITCGGAFDTATRHYLYNIIVYAHLSRPLEEGQGTSRRLQRPSNSPWNPKLIAWPRTSTSIRPAPSGARSSRSPRSCAQAA
jgi:LPXTG-site transpeptidase (sortase) family protein